MKLLEYPSVKSIQLARQAGRVSAQHDTELNFKFYRQVTKKIAGISDRAATFFRKFL